MQKERNERRKEKKIRVGRRKTVGPNAVLSKTRGTLPPGNSSYGGYEYQILVTIWAALDLVLAKQATLEVIIEPPSREDLEAALCTEPDNASSGLASDLESFQLVLQAKTRSTGPWSSKDISRILCGKNPVQGAPGMARRLPAIEALCANPTQHYVFVTDQGLQKTLTPFRVGSLLERSEAKMLPPNSRNRVPTDKQAAVAGRIALCDRVTTELLGLRIERLLTLHGHVPLTKQADCLRDLKDAVRSRLQGGANGLWTRDELLDVLTRHGGSIMSTRAMDHYVAPRSFDRIQRALDTMHAVIITGPSGTGKTLTADVLEQRLRAEAPYLVVGEQHGPGYARQHLVTDGPVLFHLRDPWGSNRLSPEGDRWSNELPKLLRHASENRKFLVTSRADVLEGAGLEMPSDLSQCVVPIEIEDYDDDRRARIYDRMCRGLTGRTLDAALQHRPRVMNSLRRPYEIDRFFATIAAEDLEAPRAISAIIADSQIDAISRVVALQVEGWEPSGSSAAAVVWGLLSAREAVAVEVIERVRRALTLVPKAPVIEIDSFIDFLVAGRSIRKNHGTLTFYHPRVEDGLRIALRRHPGTTERILGMLCDVLVRWDRPPAGTDWGTETALGILRAALKLERVSPVPGQSTRARIDDFLVTIALSAHPRQGREEAMRDLARLSSEEHIPGKLARLLLEGERAENAMLRDFWFAPPLSNPEAKHLGRHKLTALILRAFVQDVLPTTHRHYVVELVPLLLRICPDLTNVFVQTALDTVGFESPVINIEVVVTGACRGEQPPYDDLIKAFAAATRKADEWYAGYKETYRQAEEHEVDALVADHIVDEPSERYHNSREAMKTLIASRRAREGFQWILSHPERSVLVEAWAELLADAHQGGDYDELRALISASEGWHRGKAWLAAAKQWDSRLVDMLESDLIRVDIADHEIGSALIQALAASTPGSQKWVESAVRLAQTVPLERQLELVLDLAQFDGDLETAEAKGNWMRRFVDDLPSAAKNIGGAILDLLEENDPSELSVRFSPSDSNCLRQVLPLASIPLATPLICIATAAGIDPVKTAHRLLASDDERAGRAAVFALSHCGTTNVAQEALGTALRHFRWRVRKDALFSLVALYPDGERAAILAAAEDPSADVRLAFAEAMREQRWPEAIDSLIALVEDRRDFSSDRVFGSQPSWAIYRVARAAARALAAYNDLPRPAVDKLLALASGPACEDPFVTCEVFGALSLLADARVDSVLIAGLAGRGLGESLQYRPLAQAAGWALVDRVLAGSFSRSLGADAMLAACIDASPAVASPVLIAVGTLGDQGRVADALGRLEELGRSERIQLVLASWAAAGHRRGNLPELQVLPAPIEQLFASMETAKDRKPSIQDPALTSWSRSLDQHRDVEGTTAWLLNASFGLPISTHDFEPRAYRLPERVSVMTMRSLTPLREEYLGLDDGF